MSAINHLAIFLTNNANKHGLVQQLIKGNATGLLEPFNSLRFALFSPTTLHEFIEEEERHGEWIASKDYNRGIKTLSSGEQKKALLSYLLAQQPDYIILDNPFDNLDTAGQAILLEQITALSSHTIIIQLINRVRDFLPFITTLATLNNDDKLSQIETINEFIDARIDTNKLVNQQSVPPPLKPYILTDTTLVSFKNVTVSYEERRIVKDINWTIEAGEFWHLMGPNGAGKTTLLTMITGDNPKAYGQDLTLFGRKKGTGESVWEIKQKIGYLTPSMTDLFNTRHTTLEMIVSGFLDSIGLYRYPSDIQLRLAHEWLELIEMSYLSNKPFYSLSLGQQRLALIARAMVKHPPLLILDEAMSGLDDHNASLVAALINKVAVESTTTLLYVSHRKEEGLNPHKIFELTPSSEGSTGKIV